MSSSTTISSSSTATGAPYLPRNQFAGSFPTRGVDIPIASVFIFLFLIGAVTHMTFLQLNLRKGHKFLKSGMMFGFCMARMVTMSLRIVWAVYPNSARISLAAQIFVSAGIILLFIINIIFSQRILRACIPSLGWNRIISWGFIFLYFTIIATLAILVTSIVQIYHTLDRSIIAIDVSLQRFGVTYFLIVCVLPFLFIAIALLYSGKSQTDNFGTGSIQKKMAILSLSAALLAIGAAWRTSNVWCDRRPLDSSTPWNLSKAAFYVFNFTLELIVVYLYALFRIDKVFHIPNGAKGPGSYNRDRNMSNESQSANKEETST